MNKANYFKQRILRKFRRSKWIVLIVLMLLIPSVVLTPLRSLGAQSDYATFDDLNGTVAVFFGGKINANSFLIQKDKTKIASGDIISVAGGQSWAHLQLWRNNKKASPILQAGMDKSNTKYFFPCRVKPTVVVGWGLQELGGNNACEVIEVNPKRKKIALNRLYLAEAAMTKMNGAKNTETSFKKLTFGTLMARDGQGNAESILEELKVVNINYSVAKSAILEWISDSDLRYYNIATTSLDILEDRRLKGNGADLDKIFYYYKLILGVEELPQNPQINQEKLQEAIRRGYNNKNGTDEPFENIFGAYEQTENQVKVKPTNESTLIHIHDDDSLVTVEVLVGSVEVQTASNAGVPLSAGQRFRYFGGGSQGVPENIGMAELLKKPSVQIFLDLSKWSEDIKPLIQKFQKTIYPENIIR
jgi:hypothetical protein